MFVIARAITYATLFVGTLLVLVPGRIVSSYGVPTPARMGLPQMLGIALALTGAALAVASIAVFAVLGKGTPMPLDPPRRLVVRGPYRLLRNPMYLDAGLALSGAALYYESPALLAYALLFMLAMHLFAVLYEEPTLRATFGAAYEKYCARVPRWLPRLRAPHSDQ